MGKLEKIVKERRGAVKYTTLGLIDALLTETQKFSNQLAIIFPKRLNRYSDIMLSRIWRGQTQKNAYIEGVRSKIKGGEFIFPDSSLSLLANNLKKILGDGACGSLQLIRSYENNEIDGLQLIDGLTIILSKVSGQIPVTDEELSLMLVGSEVFIRNIRSRITAANSPHYNPDYKFSIEKLDIFKRNFQIILGKNAKSCLKRIDSYIRLNPDLKLYSKQQYTVTKPDYFKIMENPDQFYWLGLLWADGSLESMIHTVKLDLSTKDKYIVEKFAEALGLEVERVKDYIHYYCDDNGNLKYSKMSRLKFSCRPIADQLRGLGLLDFKSGRRGLPQVVLLALIDAKHETSKTSNVNAWYYTESGRNALSFLMGFYDGDGHYRGSLSAGIYNTNKMLLDEIKVLYRIENRVRLSSLQSEYPNSYGLALGPKIFNAMLEVYKDSMSRKRPQQLINNPNFLGELD